MTDVFISYSRKDRAFANQLVNQLEKEGREVWIDWQDIPRGEQWLNAIYEGIENADTFVFIISQHSLSSEICNYEVQHARDLNKRIIPIIRERIEGQTETLVKGAWFGTDWQAIAATNWDALRHINWVFAEQSERAFEQVYAEIVQSIDLDAAHVKQHTRYLVRARDWKRASRNASFLLTGDEIAEAESWLRAADAEAKDPPPDSTHREYIAASRNAENRRRRVLRSLQGAAATLVLTLLIGAGIAGALVNNTQEQVAVANATLTQIPVTLDAAATQAQAAQNFSDAVRLSAFAQAAAEGGNAPLGLAYALAASTRDDTPQVQRALRDLAYSPGIRTVYPVDVRVLRAMALTPDGTLMLTGGDGADQDVQIWDIETGEQVGALRGHTTFIQAIAISADGQFVVSGAVSGVAMLWDLETRTLLQTLEPHAASVTAVAISPDGETVMTGDGDGDLYEWDAATGELRQRTNSDTQALTDLLYYADGPLLIGFERGSLIARDRGVADLDVFFTDDGSLPVPILRAVALSPDGTRVVSAHSDNLILWDAMTGEMLDRIADAHDLWAEAIAFSADGRRLLSAGNSGTLYLWRLGGVERDQLTLLRQYTLNDDPLYSVAFHPDGDSALVGTVSNDPNLRLLRYDLEVGTVRAQYRDAYAAARIDGLDIRADGRLALLAGVDGFAYLLDLASGQALRRLEGHSGNINDGVFSPDGTQAATYPVGGELFVWDLATGAVLHELSNPARTGASANTYEHVAFSLDGQTLYAAHRTTGVDVFDLTTGELLAEWPIEEGQAQTLALSPNGSRLFVNTLNDGLFVVDSADGAVLEVWLADALLRPPMALSSDGSTLLLTEREGNSLIVWDVATGREVRRMVGHAEAVRALTLSADGTLAASISRDQALIVWDLRAGSSLQRVTFDDATPLDLAFLPDNSGVLTSDDAGRTTLWRVDGLAQVRDWALANRYLPDLTCRALTDAGVITTCVTDGPLPTALPQATRTPRSVLSLPTLPPPSPTPTPTPLPTLLPNVEAFTLEFGDNLGRVPDDAPQYWTFDGEEGREVTINLTMTEGGPLLVRASVFDGEGNFVTDLVPDGPGVSGIRVGFFFPEPDRPLIEVRRMPNAEDDAAYTLTLTAGSG